MLDCNANAILGIWEISRKVLLFRSPLSREILLNLASCCGEYELRKLYKRIEATPTAVRLHVQSLMDDGFVELCLDYPRRIHDPIRLYERIYHGGLSVNLPPEIIQEVMYIIGNEMDLSAVVRLPVQVAFLLNSDKRADLPKILFVKFQVGANVYRRYLYKVKASLNYEFFDEAANKSTRFLLRNPVPGSVPASFFGNRPDPKSNRDLINTGVHWRAQFGASVVSAADGIVIFAGKSQAPDLSLGLRVEIQHKNGFVTVYSNLSAVNVGVTEGAPVKIGQNIGRVGMTDSPKGAHLFYQVIINGHYVDPLRVFLVRKEPIDNSELVGFNNVRNQIDVLFQ